MSAIQTVLYDLGYLSILLLLGIFLRKKKLNFYKIYIYSSIFTRWFLWFVIRTSNSRNNTTPVYFPITESIGKWAGV